MSEPTAVPPQPRRLLAALADAVGPAQVVHEPALLRRYETDWSGHRLGAAAAAVRPAGVAEVRAVLAACAAHGVPVVVQGGNTGLVQGGVPAGGEVVVSTARMRTVGPVDVLARRVVVGAGATLADVQAAVRPLGLDVGVDLAARGSATVGGMVATNAGGEHVLRYGSMRAQLAGLRVVLADGAVVDRLTTLPKESMGYDLVGLMCGSEGTLGVVTDVALRLVARAGDRTVAVIPLDGVAAAVDVLERLRGLLPGLLSAELMLAAGVRLVRDRTGLPAPTAGDPPAYLLVDAEGDVLAALAELGGTAADAAVAQDEGSRARLRRYREAHTEAIAAVGTPLKLDVALPLGKLAGFVDELPRLAGPAARPVVFGHLAEGNLHVNLLGLDDAAARERATGTVLRRVAELGGAISAEHGVGRAKVQWLSLSRGPGDLEAMRAVKQALDPTGLLGPGVLVPPRGSS